MDQETGQERGALTQLRAYIAQSGLPPDARLPPERELVEVLGVSRGDLRKALAILENEGGLWRHVGKGTFIGARPVDESFSIAVIAAKTSPADVSRTRILIEPVIAREAALNATSEDIAAMCVCLKGARAAHTWRFYESWDSRLHRAIAEAAHNILMLAMFDTLNTVRRAVVWGRLRPPGDRPPTDHHSFDQHDAIVAAIEDRDLRAAESAMRTHLVEVATNLMKVSEAAE
jgi:GntR family transcriptional regulator, transcriptional repressor for pyruvate dehydrogenase complex